MRNAFAAVTHKKEQHRSGPTPKPAHQEKEDQVAANRKHERAGVKAVDGLYRSFQRAKSKECARNYKIRSINQNESYKK